MAQDIEGAPRVEDLLARISYGIPPWFFVDEQRTGERVSRSLESIRCLRTRLFLRELHGKSQLMGKWRPKVAPYEVHRSQLMVFGTPIRD